MGCLEFTHPFIHLQPGFPIEMCQIKRGRELLQRYPYGDKQEDRHLISQASENAKRKKRNGHKRKGMQEED